MLPMSHSIANTSDRTEAAPVLSLTENLESIREKSRRDAERFAVGYCAPRFN